MTLAYEGKQKEGISMCTALTFSQGGLYFGRNMDLEYHFGERVVITPRGYRLETQREGTLSVRYAMIGMATVVEDYPLYAEAANEKGLFMAGLNFPGNARYGTGEGSRALTPYELIPFVLGTCANLAQARELLGQVTLPDHPFRPTLPLAPLHWMVSDASGSLVVESTAEGVQLYENPYGVLTNNPPFPFHRENVRQYLHLSAESPENRFSQDLPLAPFGQGMGALGLPGDFSPASRFVKALFCKMNSQCQEDPAACVSQVFHILDAVAMVKGSVRTPEGKPDLTTYSCCIQAETGTYYYKTYENSQIVQVDLTEARKTCPGLTIFPLRNTPQFLVEEGL